MNLMIDSSVFVSSIGIDDIYTPKSRELFKKISSVEILVPTLVIAETLRTLYKQGNAKIGSISKFLFFLKSVDINQPLLQNIVQYLPKSALLKTSDWLIAATAKINNAVLITWDNKLLKYAGIICEVSSPEQFIMKLSAS